MGDFNTFLQPFESNRSMPRRRAPIEEFQSFISELGLTDLNFQGPVYTWWDGNVSSPVMRKLDRVLVNAEWLTVFDLSIANFLPRGLSDHNPAAVTLGLAREIIRKPFQLFNHILDHDSFLLSVQQSWEVPVQGNPWFILTSKLKRLKSVLKCLNRDTGNVHERVTASRSDLLAFQRNLPTVPSDIQREEELLKCTRLHNALLDEEKFLKQKSRVRWLKQGDNNNKFFFNCCKGRWNSYKLLRITDDEGVIHSGHSNIANVAVDYFKRLLGTNSAVDDFSEWPETLGINTLSEEEKNALVTPFTESDIFSTFKAMAKGKSPGPDGYPPEFFVKAWKIVGKDTSAAILSFFEGNYMPRMINSSAIALIPKHSNASHMNHYRPIACCNAIYKCIGKMIAHRMSTVMCSLVSSNQSAFVPTRSLGDNVFLAQALCKDYHLNIGPSRFACKLDVRKAFDTLNWSFILQLLHVMNFPAQFIRWIQTCITTCMYSIKINGALEGYFEAAAGIRQGDPISPYLFVLAMEMLNICFKKVIDGSDFSYHWRCKDLSLTHLIFADDLLVFCKGEQRSISLLLDAINLFSSISGLKLNTSKCTCFFSNVPPEIRVNVLAQSGFSEGSLPIIYLGLPLVSRSLKARDCASLISKICKRIEQWTVKFISQAGRLQLIRSILYGIQSFWMRFLFLPPSVEKKIKMILSRFLWSGKLVGTCMHKVSWKDCCLSRAEGGLGLRHIKIWNEAAVLYQLWRIIVKSDSLWIDWIYKYELRRKGFWTMALPSNCSWCWKKILNSRVIARNFICYAPGRHSDFLLWHDPWVNNEPLISQFGTALISALESHTLAKLHSIQSDDVWSLGPSNYHDVRVLRDLCAAIPIRGTDRISWTGISSAVSISAIYNVLTPHSSSPPWLSFVWNKFHIPKYAFTSWLIMRERLPTNDRLINFHMFLADPFCLLCPGHLESHSHLFCHCSYSRAIISACPIPISLVWTEICSGRCLLQDLGGTKNNIAYLFLSVAYYFIWQERNNRLHNTGQISQPLELIRRIKDVVKLKLSVCNQFVRAARHDLTLTSFL